MCLEKSRYEKELYGALKETLSARHRLVTHLWDMPSWHRERCKDLESHQQKLRLE